MPRSYRSVRLRF